MAGYVCFEKNLTRYDLLEVTSMSVIFVPLPNCFRAELIFTQNGQVIENVYHVQTGGALTAADAIRIAGKIAAWFSATLKLQVSGSAILQRIEVIDASQQGGVGIVYTTGLPIAGNQATSNLPGNVTVAVKWATGLTGKSFRGRTYHIGLWPAAVAGNQLGSGMQTALQNAYNALITALAGGGTADVLVVGSKRHNKAWRTTGVPTPIISCSVDNDIDSQRRRLTGTGRGT